MLTAVLPDRSDHLGACARSVGVAATHWAGPCEWVLAVDGPAPEVLLATVRQELAGTGVELRPVPLTTQQGVAAARNHALRASRGQIIVVLDADDELLPGALSVYAAPLQSHSTCGWVAAGHVDAEGQWNPAWPQRVARAFTAGELVDAWSSPFLWHPNNLAVRRELALAVGGWPALRYGEDRALLLTVSEHAAGVFVPSATVHHRRWAGQTIRATDVLSAEAEHARQFTAQMLTARRALLWPQRRPVHPPPRTAS